MVKYLVVKKKKERKRRTKIARALLRLALIITLTFLAVWILWSAFGCLGGCNNGDEDKVKLFFYDDVLGVLVPVERDISNRPDLPTSAITELIKGPLPGEHVNPTLNPNASVIEVKVEAKTASINLSADIQKLPSPDLPEKMAVYSIVNTLTSLPNIDNVEFLIDGQRLPFFSKSFDITGKFEQFSDKQPSTRQRYLYFPYQDDSFIAVEVTKVKEVISQDEQIKLLLKRFIQGPTSPELVNVFSSKTKVKNVKLAEGLLTIDFSKDALDLNTGAAGEENMLQSLIWTITELQGVRKVKILVEGKSVETLGGHISCDEPFERFDIRFQDPDITETGKAILVYLAKNMGDNNYLPVPRWRYIRIDVDEMKQAVSLMLEGPNADERDYGLTTCIPSQVALNSLERDKDGVKIDIGLDLKLIENASFEVMFVKQIALTLTEFDKTSRVLLSINSEIKNEGLPYGTQLGKRITRGP